MRAAVHDRYGGSIAIRDVPAPRPKAGEVLVRVAAASVNSWDWDQFTGNLMGRLSGPFAPRSPVLGADLAGTVEAVGDGVTALAIGDDVAGDVSQHGWGGFAEFVAAPAEAFVKVPSGVSPVEAAAVPQAGTLALQALRQRRPVQPGERVLINGAGGGCGSFAIQLAKQMGALVTAVDHASKLDFMRGLGADQVVDYERDDFTAAGARYDRIVDPVARHPLGAYRRALTKDGTLVVIGGRPVPLIAVGLAGLSKKPDGQALGLLLWEPRPAEVAELLDLAASGAVRPSIDRVYPLAETEAALRRIGEGRSLGKVIVRIA